MPLSAAKRAGQRLAQILGQADFEPTELFLSGQAICYGLGLLAPRWDPFGSSSAFAVFSVLGPPQVWGVIAIACGVTQGTALLLDMPRLRTGIATINFVFWLLVLAVYLVTHSATALSWAQGVRVLAAGWVSARLWVDEWLTSTTPAKAL